MLQSKVDHNFCSVCFAMNRYVIVHFIMRIKYDLRFIEFKMTRFFQQISSLQSGTLFLNHVV